MTLSEKSAPDLPEAVAAIVEVLKKRHPELVNACTGLLEVYQVLVGVFEAGGILYLCGNGGSFADAMHIKGELAKSFVRSRPVENPDLIAALKQSDTGKQLLENLERALPVVVLGESHSLRSAYENDREGTFGYAQELNAFAERIKPGVLLGISTSGNADNVIAAMTLAKAYGLRVISFTGFDGGQMAKMADIAWRAPGDTTPDVQENQVPLYHALCKMIEAHFFG